MTILQFTSTLSARVRGAGTRGTLWCTMQPLSFTAGKKVGFMEKTAGESAGGLFSGQSGPKPPPALSVAVLGMKPGGKRSVGCHREAVAARDGSAQLHSRACWR
jgi:hypothetical protein